MKSALFSGCHLIPFGRHAVQLLLFLVWIFPANTGPAHNLVPKIHRQKCPTGLGLVDVADREGWGRNIAAACGKRDLPGNRERKRRGFVGLSSCGILQRLRGGKGAKRQRDETSKDSQEITFLDETGALSSEDDQSSASGSDSSSASEYKEYEEKFGNDPSWSTPNSLSYNPSSQWLVGNSSEFSLWQTCDEAKPTLSVRDLRKYTKHLRAMNGGGKPVPCEEGFNALPDVLVVGGSEGDRDSALVQSFSLGTTRWRTEMSMGFVRDGCASLGWRGRMYVFGGFDGNAPQASVECFDRRTGAWYREPDMQEGGRGWCGAAEVMNRFYVVGGVAWEGEHLSSVESYDPREGKWRLEPPMRIPRAGLGVAALDGRIFACGGSEYTIGRIYESGGGGCVRKSVESFQPAMGAAGRWVAGPDMDWPRNFLGLVAMQDRLWAVGGHDQAKIPLVAVESLDPLTDDAWRAEPSMIIARARLAAVCVRDSGILAMGGVDVLNHATDTVEFYSPTRSSTRSRSLERAEDEREPEAPPEWCYSMSLPAPRVNAAAVSLVV